MPTATDGASLTAGKTGISAGNRALISAGGVIASPSDSRVLVGGSVGISTGDSAISLAGGISDSPPTVL